jgi:hypothetical protein
VQELYKTIHIGLWVSLRSSARAVRVHPFWRMGGMGFHVQEWYKSINFVEGVAWRWRAGMS